MSGTDKMLAVLEKKHIEALAEIARLRAEVERLTREMHELLQTHHEGCQAKFAQMEAVLRAVNVVLDECDLRLLGEDSEEGEKTARAIEGLYQARAAYRGRA